MVNSVLSVCASYTCTYNLILYIQYSAIFLFHSTSDSWELSKLILSHIHFDYCIVFHGINVSALLTH